MKIAFIYQQATFAMPLGLGYLSSVLKNAGFDTKFFDLLDSDDQNCLEDVIKYRPDVVGYSVISGNQSMYMEFNAEVKKRYPKVVSIFGGPHPTFFPEMVEEDGVDAICVGEGEYALLEFMKQFRLRKSLPESCPNFWIKTPQGISKSDVAPKIPDLDSLPYPDRDGFFESSPLIKNHGIKQFLAHKGCPYLCSFCFNDAYNKIYSDDELIVSRSPESICTEILDVKANFPLESVYFVDDVFTINKQWTIDFCEVYQEKVGLPFYCNLRFDNVNADVVKALKKANCYMVCVGAESGDDYIRNTVMKRNMEIPYMLDKVTLFQNNKIKMLTENIIGNPGETFDMALKTIRLNQKIKPVVANCSIFTPYPKLPLTDYAIKQNYFDGNFSRINKNYYETSIIEFEDPADKNRILNLRSFFSTWVAFSFLDKLFLHLIEYKHNRMISVFGKIMDGFFLFRTIPFSFKLSDFFKTTLKFLTLPR